MAPKPSPHGRRLLDTMTRTGAALLAIVIALAGCTSLPTASPSAAPVAAASPTAAPTDALPVCDPPPAVPGPHLGCAEAVKAARELLAPSHAPIIRLTFRYSCPDSGPRLPDCAVQMFGIVDFTFLNVAHVIPQPTLRVQVSRGFEGNVLATIVPTADG